MRVFLTLSLTALLTACHHFDPIDTIRQEKSLNIAVINAESYALIPEAQCKIHTDDNDKIVEETKVNPDAMVMRANYHTLTLDCQAPGYTQTALAITNRINHWSADDLFFLPPGNIVSISNHILPYYPTHILVLMSKKPFTSAETTEKIYQHNKAKELIFQGTL